MKIKRKSKYTLKLNSKELDNIATALDVLCSNIHNYDKGAALVGSVNFTLDQYNALEQLMFKVVNVPR